MAVLRKLNPSQRRGKILGSRAGYKLGWSYGQRLGRSEVVVRSNVPFVSKACDLSVLCVTSGMGLPFSPIDHAVIEALKKQVRELHICSPKDDLVKLTSQLRPQLVLVLFGMHVTTEVVNSVRSLGSTTAIWYSDDPYYSDITRLTAIHYDYVFTNELSCIEFYQLQGCRKVYHLPLAVDLNVFRPKRVDTGYFSDVCFIGSAYWHRVGFFNRIAPYLARRNVKIFGWWWERLEQYSKLSHNIRNEWLSPEETDKYYNGAKIVINLHRSPYDETFNKNSTRVKALSSNPRTFEICGSGAFQLTDARQDLPNLYGPGQELATYSSAEELIEKIEYYLHHEEERNDLALKGLQRTLRDHTFDHRVAVLLNVLVARR
ncbi:CgeB family protein [Paenibacillus sp. UNC451MF]|uniref:CgeB family protein n=1 Tax=Paenibacillus sp. UNC451MF TaxID=1449063 RepID=UPI00048C41E8|nr:glycosyltransferase [Paenibacillus sp. UNC451MF]